MSEDYEHNWIITVDQGGKYDGGPFGFPYPNDAYEKAFRVLKYVFDSPGDRGSFAGHLLGKQQTQRQTPTIPNNSSPPPQRKILRRRVFSSNSEDGNTLSEYVYTVLHPLNVMSLIEITVKDSSKPPWTRSTGHSILC